MSDNLKLWDAVSRVPKEHLKAFDRGTFKGTAIRPAWAYKTMTEHAGPCCEGWSIGEPQFTMVDGVKGEKLVYCVVTVTYKGGSVVGVGGDKVIKYTAPNERYNRPERWDNDDEAFKKSCTDALTNALVKIGVGADIHMGLWDGNKYVDEPPQANNDTPAPAPAPAPLPPIHNNSKANSRDDFTVLCKELRDMASIDALRRWKLEPSNIKRMESLNGDFADNFRNIYAEVVSDLKQKVAA